MNLGRTLLAVTLGAASLAGCGTTVSPTRPGSTPGQSIGATSWTEIELPDAVGAWQASGVIADAGGFVIYGGINDVPAVWTSQDGLTWASIPLPGREGQPSAAAASADATVLVGGGSTSRCAHPFGEFMWRRVRGELEWKTVPFREDLFCAGGSVDIAANDHTFMAAGMGAGDQPFAWSSDDGLAWDDAAAGIPFELPPWALGALETGFIELGRGGQADVRLSLDGQPWVRIDPPPVAPAFNGDQPGMEPVAVFGRSGWPIAVYTADDGSSASMWRRVDRTWVELELPIAAGETVAGATALPTALCVFALGAARARLLATSDLERWTDVDIPEVAAILGLARFADRLVLVGARLDAAGEANQYVVFVSGRLEPLPAPT